MSAAEYVGSTSLLAAALLTAFVGLRRGRKEAGGALPLLLFYLFVCAAIYTYLNYRVDPNPKRALSWYYCTLSLKSFAMVFLMIFALTYTNPFFKPRLHFITALLIIPLITLILCLHGQNQNLLFKMLEIPQIYPNKSLSAVRGVWFYINTFYGYACLAALLFLFYIHYKRSSVIYKWQSSIFMLGASLFALLDLESVFFGGSESASILGLVVMSVLLHVAYLYFKASDLAFIANEAVFEKISSIALVVENDGKILSMNHMARKTFSFFGGKADAARYDDLIAEWMRLRSGAILEENNVRIIQVTENEKRRSYEVLNGPVVDKNQKKIGVFVEMRDVTTQRDLIAELNYLVNHDQLTNLYNRRYFDTRRKSLDKPECLPLAFISADLNRLKPINDEHGHTAGDRLIVLAGEILTRFAPEGSIVCRMGGDEYLAVIPACGEDKAREYIENVQTWAAQHEEDPFGHVDISMGYAIRFSMDVSIQETLNSADLLMYREKKKQRESERELARPYH